MDTSDPRHRERSASDRPTHPRLQAGLLMAGVLLFLVVLSLTSMR